MRRKITLIMMVWFTVALVLVACGDKKDNASPTPSAFTTLNVQEAFDQSSKAAKAVIVDVREPNEWADTGVPEGATLIPMDQLKQRAASELPKDAEIYVICNSGNRSRVSSQDLIDLGFEHVYNIDGGIQAWLAQNLPIEPYAP